jgi:uroporphyrinogen-III synthase
VASIGPVASEALRHEGVRVDFEPSHPKMGFLVKEAAEKSAASRKRLGPG